MKAAEQDFHVVLLIMLFKVAFLSVDDFQLKSQAMLLTCNPCFPFNPGKPTDPGLP